MKVIWFGWYWVKGDFMNDIVDLKWHWCELVNITMTSRSVYIPGPPPWGFRISGNPTKIIRVSTKLFSDSLILSVIWILLQNIHHNKFQLGWLDSKCYVIILILDLPLEDEVYCYVTINTQLMILMGNNIVRCILIDLLFGDTSKNDKQMRIVLFRIVIGLKSYYSDFLNNIFWLFQQWN